MIVFLIILAVLFLIGCIPVGVIFRYHEEIELKLQILFIKIGILPKKPLPRKKREKAEAKKAKKDARKAAEKEKKKKKQQAESLIAKPKPEKPEEPKKPLPEKVAELIPWAKLGARFVGEFFHRKLTVTRLWIRAALAGGDPAKTAETVGRAWEAIGIAVPILEQAFRIKEKKIAVWPDFTAKKTAVEAELRVRLRVGGVILLVLKYVCKALAQLLRGKRAAKKEKKARQEAKQSDPETEIKTA